jgi:Tfp pilus assembly protein PilF
LAAVGLLAFAVAAAATGLRLAPWLVVFGALWLPGHVLLGLVGERPLVRSHTPLAEGPGRLAFEFMASLAVLIVGLLPAFVAGSSLASGLSLLIVLWVLLALAALFVGQGRPSWLEPRPADRRAWGAFIVAVIVCVPVIIRYAGGTVDDWWDLAVVRKWTTVPSLDFREAFLGTELYHPRWGWNVWLAFQALLARGGAQSWIVQAQVLAPLVGILAISSQAALATALFRERTHAALFTLVATPFWLWGTEAIPYFVRPHQDKFVAGLVLLPILLAAFVRDARNRDWRSFVVLGLAAAVTVSVHPLVYAIGLVGVAAVALSWDETPTTPVLARLRTVAARQGPLLAAIALYPVSQAIRLAPLFEAQGISLADPTNPVVRAHLWLGRLFGAPEVWYVVQPEAVLGPIAVVAALGLIGAGRRRAQPGDRVLRTLALIPACCIFVPGIAWAMGKLWVPWMIYRIGWLIPVPLLLGRVFGRVTLIPGARLRVLSLVVVVAAVFAIIIPTAQDRLRRDMGEHPRERIKAPSAATAAVYDFLASAPRTGGVVAPRGFASLVPALSGRQVVSFGERGTLVFSPSEEEAYRRMRDTALFYSQQADRERWQRLTARYNTAYVVFPRAWVSMREEPGLLEKSSAHGFLDSYSSGHATPWHNRSDLEAMLPEDWRIEFENVAAYVVGIPRDDRFAPSLPSMQDTDLSDQGWVEAVGAKRSLQRVAASRVGPEASRRRARVVGSSVGYPGALVTTVPAPPALGISHVLAWEASTTLWGDRPTEVEVALDLGRACEVEAIEVVPYLPQSRREALAVSVLGRSVAVEAIDGVPIRVDVGDAGPRSLRHVRVGIRSILGAAPSVSAVRVLGDRESCDGSIPPLEAPHFPQLDVELDTLLWLARQFPHHGRPLVAAAASRAEQAPADAETLLQRAVTAAPESVFAWIELGAARDRRGDFAGAVSAYETALRLDSNSAWARGVVSWARYRASWKFSALWHALKAWRLDPRYGDALTIAAYVAQDFGARDAAAKLLDHAEVLDPWRSWPALARAAFAIRDGNQAAARDALVSFLRRKPADKDVRDYLLKLETARLGAPAAR